MKYSILILLVTLVLVITMKKVNSHNSNPLSNIIMNQQSPRVNVWDTYVTKKNGEIMHFDIIAPIAINDTSTIYQFGKEYLKSKGQEGQPLTSKQCRLCHMENIRPAWETEIKDKGYFIIEMEGCN